MTYLDRPVFEFEFDWSDQVNQTFAFDLREIGLGFGAPAFTSLQTHVVRGFDLTVQLPTPADIAEFDTFTAALLGRANGFWLPSPFEAMSLVAIASGTQIDIRDQHLADTWEDDVDTHLYLVDAGVSHARKITAVAALGGGLERVTIGDTTGLTAAALVRKLHYVRLAEDKEAAKFMAEGWQQRRVRVVELPEEYTTVVTGQRPIYLYHFYIAPPVGADWYFTSFAANVGSGDILWEGVRPENTNLGITHNDRRSTVSAEDSLTIDCAWQANHPLALFFPLPISMPMFVQVLETSYADPETTTVIFTGRVGTPSLQGDKLQAKCDSFAAILKRKVPVMTIGPECNYFVFTPNCKAPQYLFETSAVLEINNATDHPPTIEVTLNSPSADRQSTGWFAQGWIECNTGLKFEIRTVLASTYDAGTGRITLTLNAPLLKAVVGDSMQVIAGCDGQHDTCKNKFNNAINFGGFHSVPEKNLSLTPLDTSPSIGGKK